MNSSAEHINYDLLMLYLTKEANAQQKQEVEDWLALSDKNRQKLNELEKIWIETGKITPQPVAVDADLAWNKVLSKIQAPEQKTIPLAEKAKTGTHLFKVIARIAAIFIIVLGGYGTYKIINKQEQQELILVSNEEVKKQVLPDESAIDLNVNSKLTYPEKFSGKKREVALEGEAFFDIAENKEQPFVVHTDIAEITVLGTSFNVKAYPGSGQIEVFVETGRVLLEVKTDKKTGADRVILEAGMAGIIDRSTMEIKMAGAVDMNKLFWKTNKLIFNEMVLADVFNILQEQYKVKLRVANHELENCVLSATFEDHEIDYIMEIIANSFELNVTKEGSNSYLIDGHGCE